MLLSHFLLKVWMYLGTLEQLILHSVTMIRLIFSIIVLITN